VELVAEAAALKVLHFDAGYNHFQMNLVLFVVVVGVVVDTDWIGVVDIDWIVVDIDWIVVDTDWVVDNLVG